MTPQRLVYVLKIFPKLSETFIAGELAELRRRGIEFRILSLLPPREELRHDILRSTGLEQLTVYEPEKFASVVREFRPQLLHAHFATESTASARKLATAAGLPFTFTAHGYDIHRKPPPDFHERAAAARAVVTVSESNADYINKIFEVPRAHIHVISCGVDTEQFCPMASNQPTPSPSQEGSASARAAESSPPGRGQGWVSKNDTLLVCVARQVKVKNLGLLLDACAELRNRAVEFRCAMIGDGPLHAELKAKRTELGLESIVEMPGAAEQSEVLTWWQRAAVAVLTSDNEGMPVSLMEAAACGVPAVSTRVGGVSELVQDNVTGLLTPAGDAVALADALEKLLHDAALRARLGAAARRRAEEKFSVKHQVDQLLALWSDILSPCVKPFTPALSPSDGGREKPGQVRSIGGARKVSVSDPFGAARDPAMPTIAVALDPLSASAELKHRLPRLAGEKGRLKLKAIRVIRHKPDKRCVVEYDVKTKRSGMTDEPMTLIGKVRARRSGNEGFRQLEAIWNAGFQTHSADGISVPEPIGVISKFQMWFQRKVEGATATKLLATPDGVRLVVRIAEAIHKLHRANVPTERAHTMTDELRILRECLIKVAGQKPEWSARIERLMQACERLGATVPEPKASGIHRDFYPAQVIVNGSRLFLIDFDLYCTGDPGLDVGNFIAHMTEQSLRELGHAEVLAEQERGLEERFVELSGESVRNSVCAYTTLTLARHIFLSTQFPERQKFTESLLKLCEQRLHL